MIANNAEHCRALGFAPELTPLAEGIAASD